MLARETRHDLSADRAERRLRAGWLLPIVLLAALLAGCAAPVAARVVQGPDSVFSCLSAAVNSDLDAFLDGFALEQSTESREAYAKMYQVWLAEATDLEWEVIWTEPRVGGGQAVVVEVVGTFGNGRERFSHVFATELSGKIVYWVVVEESPGFWLEESWAVAG